MDPNSAATSQRRRSDESMSGDELDRTRKRLRTNNKRFRYFGQEVDLPKAKKHRAYSFEVAGFHLSDTGLEHYDFRMWPEWPTNNANEFLSTRSMEFMLGELRGAPSLEITEIPVDCQVAQQIDYKPQEKSQIDVRNEDETPQEITNPNIVENKSVTHVVEVQSNISKNASAISLNVEKRQENELAEASNDVIANATEPLWEQKPMNFIN